MTEQRRLSVARPNYGEPYEEPRSGAKFTAVFTVRVGYSNGDFRHVVLIDDRGREWTTASIPFRALREVRDEPREMWMVVRPDSKIPGGWRVVLADLSEELARRIAAERPGHEAMATSFLYEIRMEAMGLV